jgi:hypothetical protein
MAFDPTPGKSQDIVVGESAAHRGGPGASINTMSPEPQPPRPEAVDGEWVVLQSAPSINLTDSGASSGDVSNGPRPTPLDTGHELTADRLQLHNSMFERGLPERIWEKGDRRSVMARKGKSSATRASIDSVDALGPWVPVENSSDPAIFAVGSWVDVPVPPNLSKLSLY